MILPVEDFETHWTIEESQQLDLATTAQVE
jgi:hypothetical protein